VIALIGAAIGGYMWWSISSLYETTDDAFIQARFFTVSPKVAGYIVSVPVTDNQMIKTGDTLTIIDDRDYKTALASAEAQLAQAEAALPNIDAQIAGQEAQISQAQAQINDAEAALKFAKEQNDRAQHLAKTGAGTVQTAQQTESQLLQAQATADRAHAALNAAQKQLAALKAQRVSAEGSIQQAGAQRDQARLNLGYTLVKADQAGRVTQLTAAKGQLVQAGQSLMVIVPDPLWVVANFRETQISGMRAGQPVDISVDAYPNQTFKGHVDSIQSGSGTVFSLLPAENATGNFVKVVQRVPVKIDFDKKPEVILGPGMSVVPWVRIK
jgi:membrane fusion protein (multidrug efflux system)